MKVWPEGSGFAFSNSAECFGESFDVLNAPLNLARITIGSRYPEEGYLYNLEAHEMVYVVTGSGSLHTPDSDTQKLSAGDAIYLEPGQRFAWDGDMSIVTACSPAFENSKHIAEEKS